jgi:hypothetical protein
VAPSSSKYSVPLPDKARVAKRVAAGLCITKNCKRKSTDGTQHCTEHRARRAQWFRERRLKGICRQCPSKVVPGTGNCTVHLEYARSSNLKRLHGITAAEYDAMHAAQGGLCAICDQPETNKWRGGVRMLAVDHDHATGRNRALLCHECNVTIGYLERNKGRLQDMLAYIQRYKA